MYFTGVKQTNKSGIRKYVVAHRPQALKNHATVPKNSTIFVSISYIFIFMQPSKFNLLAE